MIICSTRFLSAKFGHSDYITLTFKAEFVCPACSDFITSSYLNAPEALKLHTNGFSLYYYDIHCVHCYKHPHLTWPVLMPYSTHLDQNHFLMMEIVTWNIPLSNGKTENNLLGVWFWGSVSHFRSRPFVTGSYTLYSFRSFPNMSLKQFQCPSSPFMSFSFNVRTPVVTWDHFFSHLKVQMLSSPQQD